MRLYITKPSPYARKCRIVAREKGLTSRVEEVVTDLYEMPADLLATNPIAQVPALVDDDGEVFIDSPLICAYFDHIGDGPELLPRAGSEHWRVRRLEALADGALEMGVKLVLEKRRPDGERSPSWMEKWTAGLFRALDVLEQELPDRTAPFDIGSMTAALGPTWIGFRHPELDWKAGRPRLAALNAAYEQRQSFKDTLPF